MHFKERGMCRVHVSVMVIVTYLLSDSPKTDKQLESVDSLISIC